MFKIILAGGSGLLGTALARSFHPEGHEIGVPPEWHFSVGVGRAWEEAVDKIPTPHTRRVKMRAAIVIVPVHSGAFNIYMNLVRLGLGGKHGDGRQFVSWIHERDYVRAVRFL